MALSTEDRLAIYELYARYTHTFDSGEAEQWAEVFAPHGGYVYLNARREAHHGREVLVEWARELHRAFEGQDVKARPFHLTSNVAIEETHDGAHGCAYVVSLVIGEEGLRFHSAGWCDDDLVLTPDGWRFAERRYHQWSPEALRGQFFRLGS